MRIVHTRPLCPSDISPASGGNPTATPLGFGFRRNDGGVWVSLLLDVQGGIEGGSVRALPLRWYDPPASRFARRVPLLLRQKGDGSGFRGNDVCGGVTKFGMLRLALGRVRAGSNACEVSALMDSRLRGNDVRRER